MKTIDKVTWKVIILKVRCKENNNEKKKEKKTIKSIVSSCT